VIGQRQHWDGSHLHLLSFIAKVLQLLAVELLVDCAHVHTVGQLLHFHSPFLAYIVTVDLGLQLRVHQVLHIALAVNDALGDESVFFGAEVGRGWLTDVFSIDLLAETFHFHLFLEDLSECILFLLAFDIAGHLEPGVFLFQTLELFLVLDLLLTRAHEIHFEAFTGVFDDTVGVLNIIG